MMGKTVNGINVADLQQFTQDVRDNPARGAIRFNVKTKWQGQTRTVASVDHYELGARNTPAISRLPPTNRPSCWDRTLRLTHRNC